MMKTRAKSDPNSFFERKAQAAIEQSARLKAEVLVRAEIVRAPFVAVAHEIDRWADDGGQVPERCTEPMYDFDFHLKYQWHSAAEQEASRMKESPLCLAIGPQALHIINRTLGYDSWDVARHSEQDWIAMHGETFQERWWRTRGILGNK